MESKISAIKTWLDTGSINIFGIQFSGKDTVGKQLADVIGAEFLSSGDVVRANANSEKLKNSTTTTDQGLLAPTEEFSALMEDYLLNQTPADSPLILSSVGRWIGEEQGIMKALNKSGHPTKAVLAIDISTDEVFRRWKTSLEVGDRGLRADDTDGAKVARRISEFKDKTLPVIEVYRQMGLLVEINGEQSRDEVFEEVIDKLASRASASQ